MAKSQVKKSVSHNPLFVKPGSYVETNRKKVAPKNSGKGSSSFGHVFVAGAEDKNQIHSWIEKHSLAWQTQALKKSVKDVIHFVSADGPVWIIALKEKKYAASHSGLLEESAYAWGRDHVGSLLSFFKAYQLTHVNFHFKNCEQDVLRGALVGMDLAAYSYKSLVEMTKADFSDLPTLTFDGLSSEDIFRASREEALAMNLARHCVNTPPNWLNPSSYSQFAKGLFAGRKNVKVEIWDIKRLEKERMGLHLAVGAGSPHPPALVHIRYRPQKKSKQKPIAFVGKGITFDTGGVDIKPSSAMRLMKKDMGGSAAVLALAHWCDRSQYDHPVDFYLALAENSVDGRSFRPSDVAIARNGMKVEIHNTDAEGRLVLADALDVAVKQKGADEPEYVIDVATLTGAIKVALGAEIAGLFSNHDDLAEELASAGQRSGDLNWRMPMLSRYTSAFSTPFADVVNAVDGFGGAITAALFLEKFVINKPWAHLDIYAWNDKAGGPLSFSGGNGQAVQGLIEYLKSKQ